MLKHTVIRINTVYGCNVTIIFNLNINMLGLLLGMNSRCWLLAFYFFPRLASMSSDALVYTFKLNPVAILIVRSTLFIPSWDTYKTDDRITLIH